MKEKFESRTLSRAFSVSMKDKNGQTIGKWEGRKETVVKWIQGVVDDIYHEQGYKMTNRQLYYELVGKALIPNNIKVYKKLNEIISDCRYTGLVDWKAFEDRLRVATGWRSYTSPGAALESVAKSYRRDRQEGQRYNIEVWSEKDAISGYLKPTTSKYGLTTLICRGFLSDSALYSAYNRIGWDWVRYEKPTKVIYLGDHDPSGVYMIYDLEKRIRNMLVNSEQYDIPEFEAQDAFEIIPAALTLAQVKAYDLPPNFAKSSDLRTPRYIKDFGFETCWEVDALKPKQIEGILEAELAKLIDFEAFEDVMQHERDDEREMQEFIDKFNSND